MAQLLDDFLKNLTPICTDAADWGKIYLEIAIYLTDHFPTQPDLINSVRTVVFKDDTVLVLEDTVNSFHLLPGGRIEASESYEEALRRELLEETGWTLSEPSYIGFAHLHHTTPPLPQHPFPYPDIFHLLYVANALEYQPQAIVEEDFVISTQFLPFDKAKTFLVRESQKILLDELLKIQLE